MTESNPLELTADLVDIAIRAGEAILEIYEQEIEVIHKDDQSALTQADLASHRIICDSLASRNFLTSNWSRVTTATLQTSMERSISSQEEMPETRSRRDLPLPVPGLLCCLFNLFSLAPR